MIKGSKLANWKQTGKNSIFTGIMRTEDKKIRKRRVNATITVYHSLSRGFPFAWSWSSSLKYFMNWLTLPNDSMSNMSQNGVGRGDHTVREACAALLHRGTMADIFNALVDTANHLVPDLTLEQLNEVRFWRSSKWNEAGTYSADHQALQLSLARRRKYEQDMK